MSSLSGADITAFNGGPSQYKQPQKWGNKEGRARAVFTATGGKAIGAHSLDLTIPKGAHVTKAHYKVLTTFTSATDAATIALSVVAANDVVSAIAISDGSNPWDAGGLVLGLPSGDMSDELAITTADVAVTATVAVEALTAGKLVVFVEWAYVGDLDLT
jgi:hypothetical protein